MEMHDPPVTRIVIIETQSETIVQIVLRELATARESQLFHIERIDHMGDINNVNGQAGAVGSNSSSSDNSFKQVPTRRKDDIDLMRLALELEAVRMGMRQQSDATPTAEQDDEMGHIARAQIAAKKGDGTGALAHLKQAGTWAFKIAKETGAEVVASTLAHLVMG
jgi:hypothetical protein